MADKNDRRNQILLIATLAGSIALGSVFLGIRYLLKKPYTIQANLESNKKANFYPLIGPDEPNEKE